MREQPTTETTRRRALGLLLATLCLLFVIGTTRLVCVLFAGNALRLLESIDPLLRWGDTGASVLGVAAWLMLCRTTGRVIVEAAAALACTLAVLELAIDVWSLGAWIFLPTEMLWLAFLVVRWIALQVVCAEIGVAVPPGLSTAMWALVSLRTFTMLTWRWLPSSFQARFNSLSGNEIMWLVSMAVGFGIVALTIKLVLHMRKKSSHLASAPGDNAPRVASW
jgi:hypothetical protein